MPGEIPEARFRLPNTFEAKPDLRVDNGPKKSLLVGQHSDNSDLQAIYLGKHAESQNRDVWMDVRGAHVVYVMGKRRSGKSYSLGVLAEGLVSNTWIRQSDSSPPGVLVLDTMNVFLTMPYSVSSLFGPQSSQARDLAQWKLSSEELPVNLYSPLVDNIPEGLKIRPLKLRASDLGVEEWSGLFDVDPFVDPMGHLLSALHARILSSGQQEFNIDSMIHTLSVDAMLQSFQQDTIAALTRRLEAVKRSPMFGDGGLDIRELIRPGEISIALLRDVDQEVRTVLVSLIVKKMLAARGYSEQQERLIPVHLSRAEKYEQEDPKRAAAERKKAETCKQNALAGLPRAWLLIDEAHNYIPNRSAGIPSHRPLKKYVDEGRNLGLSIVVATQQPSGLDRSIQRNADILLIHSLSHRDDINVAQGMINVADFDEVILDGKYRLSGPRTFESIIRSLGLGYSLVSTDRANRLFPVKMRPRITFHGGGDY